MAAVRAGCVTPPAQAQSASIFVNSHHVKVGHKVVFTGIVNPNHRGQVLLQQFRGSKWHYEKLGHTNRFGHYSITVHPDFGLFVGRVEAVKSPSYKVGFSKSRRVHIVKH